MSSNLGLALILDQDPFVTSQERMTKRLKPDVKRAGVKTEFDLLLPLSERPLYSLETRPPFCVELSQIPVAKGKPAKLRIGQERASGSAA